MRDTHTKPLALAHISTHTHTYRNKFGNTLESIEPFKYIQEKEKCTSGI